ncbi:hypothetical protein HI914_02102 [Erysiphe necator]|nr:hypothetical protein HI914_02102 [Erysiphe necator]
MITEMITSLNSQIHIWLDEPTYISSIGSPFSSDIFKLSEILCKVGEKKFVTTGIKRKIGNEDIYMNMSPKIMIASKPLLIAIRDLEKIIEKARVKMDFNNRAGRYRLMSIEHDDTKRKLWKELVILCSGTDKKK